MYYIEGTIDAIEISGANFGRLRFSLIPASERILSRDGGKKMALFTDRSSPSALLVETGKNAAGKEVLWFHAEPPWAISSSRRKTTETQSGSGATSQRHPI